MKQIILAEICSCQRREKDLDNFEITIKNGTDPLQRDSKEFMIFLFF